MESIEQEIMQILVERLCSSGFLSKNTCEKAVDLIHSMTDLPEFFRYPAAWDAEVDQGG